MLTVLHCIIKFCNLALCDGLKICINGGYDRIAIRCIFCFDLIIRIWIDISIFFTVNAIQFIIIIIFQPADTFVTGCGKSKQGTSQGVIRIVSDIFLFKPDTFDIFSCFLVILQRLKFGNFFIWKLLCQNVITLLRVCLYISSDIICIEFKTLCQCWQRRFHIIFLRSQNAAI